MKNHTPRNPDELRRQAEERLKEREGGQRSTEEMAQTLHELRVHQIELEMQNEQLRTAQAKIEAGRTRYYDLYDLAPVGYCTVSEKGLILEANLTAATLLGTTRGALVNQPISRFILKDDQDIYYLLRKKLFEAGEPQECELRLVKPDGAFIWAHLTATAAQAEDGTPVCRMALTDITERKQAEEELRESEERYRCISEDMPALICRFLPDYTLSYVNRAYCDFFGKSANKLVGTSFLTLIPDADRVAVKSIISSLTVEAPVVSSEYRALKPDKTVGWQKWTDRALFDEAGRIVAYQAIGEDITERKQAEDEIEKSWRMTQSTIDSLNANICMLDERGNIISVNESWREFAQANGATPAKTCEGTNYLEVCGSVQGEDRVMALEFAEGIRGVMRGETDCFEREYPCHSPDQKRWFNGSVTPIRDGENGLNRVVIAHMDITERKRLTNDLLRAEKLAAVGELVAGVAHEIKNPLNTMMGFAQLLLVREEELEEGVKKDIQKMHGAARRVDRITDGLLNFARKGQEEKSRVDINEVLMETLELKKDHLESRHIKVDKKLAPEMPPVTASKDQMEQVFLNLINNAEYFMSEKDGAGILTLRTSLAEEKIKIEILDSGPRIPEGILDDLFSPFFTGKPEGVGTGLGLSVSYGIVEEHGGRLEAANRKGGEGAVFTVILPLNT